MTPEGKRIATAAAILAAVSLTIGIGSALADSTEDYFLNELYKTHQKWIWPFGEGYIIGEGHRVCNAWVANTPYNDEVDALAAEKDWTHRNTRYFIALSTATFCPERYVLVIPPEARLPDGR